MNKQEQLAELKKDFINDTKETKEIYEKDLQRCEKMTVEELQKELKKHVLGIKICKRIQARFEEDWAKKEAVAKEWMEIERKQGLKKIRLMKWAKNHPTNPYAKDIEEKNKKAGNDFWVASKSKFGDKDYDYRDPCNWFF